MSSHSIRALAVNADALSSLDGDREPVPARLSDDRLAQAVRLAIASLAPGGEALRALESASFVPHAGLNVPELGQ